MSADELRLTPEYRGEMAKFGTGSALQQRIQAATAAVQGLAGGNLGQALAGGAAPYLAEVIHRMTTDPVTGKVNTEANLMAHAVLGAVTAAAGGNGALAGASAAAMGEYIAQQMYPGVKRENLTEAQKQTISALGTLAAGLAGELVGDSTAAVISGAQGGRNAVENNLLGGNEESQAAWIRQHGINMASCSDNPGGSACQKAKNERDAAGLALATGSVTLLPGSVQAMWGLGASANAGINYLMDGTIDPANSAIAGWVNVISMGNSLAGTVGWNAAGGAVGNWIDGKDPTFGAIMNGGSSAIGYGTGKIIQRPLEKVINPNWKNWEWTDIGVGVSKPLPLNPAPGIAGNIGSSIGSEGSGVILQEQIRNQQERMK